jgi:hypothetical protein
VKPQSGGPYDFTCHHKEFHAALERLARRSSRGLPIPPPDNPAQGWYAHHLCDQPNATIRAALNGVGECDLWDFLYGSADFTRFRFWQVSSADMRSHLVEAQGEQTAVLEMGTSGKAAMDAALMEWHREGKIAWWPEAG